MRRNDEMMIGLRKDYERQMEEADELFKMLIPELLEQYRKTHKETGGRVIMKLDNKDDLTSFSQAVKILHAMKLSYTNACKEIPRADWHETNIGVIEESGNDYENYTMYVYFNPTFIEVAFMDSIENEEKL